MEAVQGCNVAFPKKTLPSGNGEASSKGLLGSGHTQGDREEEHLLLKRH